jgi:hypothetical protein
MPRATAEAGISLPEMAKHKDILHSNSIPMKIPYEALRKWIQKSSKAGEGDEVPPVLYSQQLEVPLLRRVFRKKNLDFWLRSHMFIDHTSSYIHCWQPWHI